MTSQSKKVLILTGDGGESYEALYAIHRLIEEGHQPVVAAPSKRRLHLVIHDFEEGWDTYIERSPGYGVTADLAIGDVDAALFDAILILGGRAPEYLRNDARVLHLVKRFAEADKFLFAICHGIQVLAAAGVVDGCELTCYEHVRWDAERAGGVYRTEQAVRSGRIVTAQTWQSHPEFYRAVIGCLSE
jgi:protease I